MKKYKTVIGSAFFTEAKCSLRCAPGLKHDCGYVQWPAYEMFVDSIVAVEVGVNNAIFF